jgi:hypothetical protein
MACLDRSTQAYESEFARLWDQIVELSPVQLKAYNAWFATKYPGESPQTWRSAEDIADAIQHALVTTT